MSYKSERHLFEAIEQCKLNKIIHLVKLGHNIHIQNTVGQNFLVYILQQQQQQQDSLLTKKRFQIFQFLITNYNLDIHTRDFYGKNIFNWATNLNCTQEVLYLLQSYPGDIDILIRDQLGSCSLHYAIEHGNEILVHDIVNYLLRYRLRFDIRDSHYNTPEDLARKLGYDKIGHFLAQACRSTIFMSREIPFQQQPPSTNKSKITTNSNVSASTTSLLLDYSEYFNLTETRIDIAKSINDWKTVAALRDPKGNLNVKHSNKISNPTKLPPMKITRQSVDLSEQMLHLIEPQLSSSYRRSFIPIYPQLINPNVSFQRSSITQRLISQESSRRVSPAISQRKRDSEASQMSISILQDAQTRFSLPAFSKLYRQSIGTTH